MSISMHLKLKGKSIYLLLLLMIVFVWDSKSQTGFEFYPLENQYNSSSYNPAFLSSRGQFTLSIFPFAGTSIGYNNQSEIQQLVKKLISGINKDVEYINLAKIMVDRPTYNQRLENELLSFTYRAKDGFWNFRISENASFSASVKGPVSLFMIKPEVRSVAVGQVQKVPALILHYREYSIGYSTPEDHRALSLGVRAKLYYGKAAFSSGISGSVNELGGTYYLKMKGTASMSMPETSTPNDDGSVTTTPSLSGSSVQQYLMNSGTPGFGIDLGAKYQFTSKFSASASIIDLGAINWKNNLNSKDFNGNFLFKSWSINETEQNGVRMINKTADSISFTDDVSSLFKVKPSNSTFSTPMPVTIYAGFNYTLNPIVQLNLTDRYIQLKRMSHNSFSLTANVELSKRFTLNTGFAAIGNAYNNIPFALLYNPDFGQIYIGTDNLLSVIAPQSSEFTGFSFGMCFYIFRKRDLYDNPTEAFPYHRPKKVKKVQNTGRIQQEYDEFYPQ
jgi:hypothetical protein